VASTTEKYEISVVNQSNYIRNIQRNSKSSNKKQKTCYMAPGCAAAELLKRLRSLPNGFYMHFSSNRKKNQKKLKLNFA